METQKNSQKGNSINKWCSLSKERRDTILPNQTVNSSPKNELNNTVPKPPQRRFNKTLPFSKEEKEKIRYDRKHGPPNREITCTSYKKPHSLKQDSERDHPCHIQGKVSACKHRHVSKMILSNQLRETVNKLKFYSAR